MLAAVFIVILALFALWGPWSQEPQGEFLFLVVDPHAAVRGEISYKPLSRWLNEVSERPLQLLLRDSLADLTPETWQRIDLVLCPDGVALRLPENLFDSLAVGRRGAPNNLRPRSVLVYRQEAGLLPEPWFTRPERTILGDSLSLAGFGATCSAGVQRPPGEAFPPWRRHLTWGPDPYDHAPVLHALRLGCFDYAVVQELAANDFFANGLLDPQVWKIEKLTDPLPGPVVLVARRNSTAIRMRLSEKLVGLGRHPGDARPGEMAVLAGLAHLGLDGFNLLLENDFAKVRKHFDHCWPRKNN
jgi:hypothetical protein